MISGIVIVGDARLAAASPRPDRLARSLSALVPAVVEGLLSDVVVAGAAIDAGDRRIADHAGCRVLTGHNGLTEALRQASRPHVFLLLSGAVPEEAFVDEVGLLMREGEAPRHTLLLRERRQGLAGLLPSAPIVGVLAPRASLSSLGETDFARLARLRPARDLNVRARRVL